jgi:hypothetical protein
MNNLYRILISCTFTLLLPAINSQAQNNNLAAGDLAFVSFQSDVDVSNHNITPGGTNFWDRFSIAVLKSGGLPAGTVIYFTDNGWNASANNFISGTTEGFIKWVVPAGGVAAGTEVYFISSYDDVSSVTTWAAYTTESGIATLGTVTTESGTNYMELSTAGDQVLAYQTGPTAGPAAAYNNATRRFIAAIHTNIEQNITTYAAWDGNTTAGANQSSLPPGLTNGTTAILLSQAAILPITTLPAPTDEPDNAKLTNPATACSTSGLSAIINNKSNWTFSNTAFAIGATSNHNTYTLNDPITIATPPANATVCAGTSASFNVAANGSGTLSYQWQESANAAFTAPVTLSNTGVYSGVNTNALSIADNTGLGTRYYRAVVTNTCGSVNTTGALLTLNSTLPTAATTVTQATGINNNLFYTACTLVTKVVPSGANPVTGNVTSQVWVESSVPTFASQPFVARHYQITPAANATTATASVTLYFTQAEFTAFNAAAGSTLDLPTGPSDNAGKSNLRVGKYPGTSNNGTGLPGSYTSGTTIIDPADNDIVWNATYNRWEVTVDVTGFSGFIIQTSAIALPLNLLSFTGQLNNNDVSLQWQTSDEINHSYFEVERSADGQTYTAVGRIAATGNNGNLVQNYSWVDAGAGLLNAAKLFYRLKMVSTTGEVEYSSVVTIKLKSTSPVVEVSPNPFTSSINISLQMPEAARLNISISDITGKLLMSENVTVPKGLTIHPVTGINNLTQGLYILSVKFNGQTHTYKIVK